MTRRIFVVLVIGVVLTAGAQAVEFQGGVDLAIAGHCAEEAMPQLDAAMRDASVSDLDKRTVSIAGVRCSMLLNQQSDCHEFSSVGCKQKYPGDAEILFLAVHVFSDLSERKCAEVDEIGAWNRLWWFS